MNLNDFKSELEGYLGKLSGLMPIGHPWWGFDPKSKPAGVQLFSGQELSREAYPKHWELINSGKRTLVTEEEWQEMVANQGFCQFYSSGDGSTTYRMPLVRGVHPKFVAALAEAGQYKEAGVPDIDGYLNLVNSNVFFNQNATSTGGVFAVSSSTVDNAGNYQVVSSGVGRNIITFAASRSNPIYGNSDTVQPEALTLLVGEYVISSVAALSTSESENLLASVTQLEASKLDKTGGGITGNLSVSGDVFVGGTINASISGTSENAVKASQDALGNIIDETYATKASVANVVRSVNGVTPDTAGNAELITCNLSNTQLAYKFGNGLMIVSGKVSYGTTNAYTTTVTFIEPFYQPPVVTVSASRSDNIDVGNNAAIGQISKTGFFYSALGLTSQHGSNGGCFIAIGSWK